MSMAEGRVEDSVKTVAEVVSGVLEKAPIYEDAAQPALREIGQGLGGMLKMVVLPFKIMGFQADKWLSDFQERLEKKGEVIPEGNLQAPDPKIAGPIIQSLGYTLHDETLREMFTNLLITGMNSEREGEAHPAFVEIIKQLTNDEAKIINWLSRRIEYSAEYKDGKVTNLKYSSRVVQFPIVNFAKVSSESGGRGVFRRNACDFAVNAKCLNPNFEDRYIDNLVRLGIINVKFDSWFIDNEYYKELQGKLDEIKTHFEDDKHYLDLDKGVVEITAFGLNFIIACALDLSDQVNPKRSSPYA